MRQTAFTYRKPATANAMPASRASEGEWASRPVFRVGDFSWHVNCFGVIEQQPIATQRSWTPSRPNSQNTGLPARRCRWTNAPAVEVRIRCRRPNRKPGRNSPSASTRRAAFTDSITHSSRRICRVARAWLRSTSRLRQPVPLARYLPPGGLFFALSTPPFLARYGPWSRSMRKDGIGAIRAAHRRRYTMRQASSNASRGARAWSFAGSP